MPPPPEGGINMGDITEPLPKPLLLEISLAFTYHPDMSFGDVLRKVSLQSEMHVV